MRVGKIAPCAVSSKDPSFAQQKTRDEIQHQITEEDEAAKNEKIISNDPDKNLKILLNQI